MYGGNVKAIKLLDESQLPAGTKNLPFDMGVKSGTTPMNLVFATVDDETTESGKASYLYILDAAKQ